MKKIQIALFLGLFAVCITVFALTQPQGATSHAQSNASNVPVNVPTVNPHTLGLPAIVPHHSSNAPNNTGGAAFTSNDVRNYVNTHPVPGAPLAGPKPVITKIIFESSQEVSKLLKGENTGFPDGTLLCYVEFHGTFTFAGPSGKTVTYQTGYEAFDAQTGNLVMSGGM